MGASGHVYLSNRHKTLIATSLTSKLYLYSGSFKIHTARQSCKRKMDFEIMHRVDAGKGWELGRKGTKAYNTIYREGHLS